MNDRWLDTGRTKKYGIAFGDGSFMSSPPSRSQIWGRTHLDRLPESGFGGWADEKIKTAREAVPQKNDEPLKLSTEPKKISSTTFDNSSFRAIRYR